MNRIVGVVTAVTWVVAMTVLIGQDVVPFWTAQEAPRQVAPGSAFQVAIRNSAGVRLGTTWVSTTPTTSVTTLHSTTLLDLRPISTILPGQRPLLFDTTLTYHSGDVLDQFRLRLEGAGIPILVVGERCGQDFTCRTTLGSNTRTMPLDGRLSEFLVETLRPFTHLKDLHVGQTWRIRLLDPFSLLRGQRPDFKIQLVTVTRREVIDHGGRQVECHRVETEGAVAWADQTGRVLRQEVQLPLLGRWVLTDERFDREARQAALALVRNEPGMQSVAVGEDHQP